MDRESGGVEVVAGDEVQARLHEVGEERDVAGVLEFLRLETKPPRPRLSARVGVGEGQRGRGLSLQDDQGDEIAAALDRLPNWGFRPPPGLA